MSQIYLVTGATRGLGKGLVATFLARPDTTVVAAARSPTGDAAKALDALPKGDGSRLLLVKLESTSPTDATAAVAEIEKAGIDHIDTVVANAGISDDFSPVAKVPVDVFKRHMETNGYGTLYLIQAVLPLLSKAKSPRFVGVGSAMGSISGMDQRAKVPSGAYGPSKAVVHYLVRKLHFENDHLISFAIDPGFVDTDMGAHAVKTLGMARKGMSTEDCVASMVKLIDNSTKENSSGRNMRVDGTEFPW